MRQRSSKSCIRFLLTDLSDNMRKIETTDNNLGERFISIDGQTCDGDGVATLIDEATRQALLPFAGISLSELVRNNPGLIVFPPKVGGNEDGVDDACLFSLPGGKLTTHNIAGVFSVGEGAERVQISIRSRFDKDNPRQYFLMAMLKKVLGLNLLDLPASSGDDCIWDLLPCLLPYYLKCALTQGMFRCYRHFKFNDSEVRGTIDLGRHLGENVPFRGTVAYETREHTDNNAVVHLVRHAIESVARDPVFQDVLSGDEETRKAVAQIRMATPDYVPSAKIKIIGQNIREIRHPYYTNWTDLQRLCLRILRHDPISFNGDGEGIFGIVFDVAWLWEEYLACFLREFTHAQNKRKLYGINLFTNGHRIYPDFYAREMGVVLDAKYKHLERQGYVLDRNDLNQMVTYLHVLPGSLAVLLYPWQKNGPEDQFPGYGEIGELNGHGGRVAKLSVAIPRLQSGQDFQSYTAQLEESMLNIRDRVRQACSKNEL